MNKRILGKNGITLSEVGLGCWQFGGDFGRMDEATAFEIMNAAVESGVDFFDTADVYGAGISEEYIGQFAKQCETPLTIATKFGRGSDLFPDHYTKENVRKSIEDSLTRLQLDQLDLMQAHCIPIECLRKGDVFNWLREFKQEGLIKHFGVSVETVEEGLICLEQEGLLSLQVIFNVFRSKLVGELLPQAKAKGVGILARLPLASGLLSGKYSKETLFAETDHRNYNRDGKFFNVGETFAGLPFEKGVELADQLKQMLPENMGMVQMVLRWILDHDAVSAIIPGASRPEQAQSNAAISDLPPLPKDLHAKLARFYEHEVKQHIRGAY
ncbi:MAG: aryl-alcohol dehydrogenase-like predicted oxidoreductase [Mariniblastus sp.]|jgi:aryl-alcohol dehydrogenase-like predicted oxidoreductase